jgi:hypothetical protein
LPSAFPGSWVYLDGFMERAGSFGIPVRDRTTRETVLLAAAHTVGALSPGFGRTNRVMFGSSSMVGGSTDELLGQLIRSVPTAPCQELDVDAAIVRPAGGVQLRREISGGPTMGSARDLLTETLKEPIPVHKRGARTGFTSGWLHTATTTVTLDDATQGACLYLDAFLIEPSSSDAFALPGDSGSIVVDDHDRVVGMVVGVLGKMQKENERPAICFPIMPTLDALDVDLIGPG